MNKTFLIIFVTLSQEAMIKLSLLLKLALVEPHCLNNMFIFFARSNELSFSSLSLSAGK